MESARYGGIRAVQLRSRQGRLPVSNASQKAPAALRHMIFAPEFDPAFYREAHKDLATFTDDALIDHYAKHGQREGRLCSPMARREAFLEALTDIRPALEIGPFCNPALTGPDVRYTDVMPTEQIRAAAVERGLDPDKTPHIDYVGTSLHRIQERFALVFSSHNVEHHPNLIDHLSQVAKLIKIGGIYALIVPDCRFCFDHFLAPSNIAEVYEAHQDGRTTHTLRKVIEHRTLTTHNDPPRHWRGDHGDPRPRVEDIPAAIKEHMSRYYVDVHAWQFTPASFRAIVEAFRPQTGLEPIRVYETPIGLGEFCAVLQKV